LITLQKIVKFQLTYRNLANYLLIFPQWSRRLASTLSNRTRQADDDDEDESNGNCIFGKQVVKKAIILNTLFVHRFDSP
jgi:hypothetical protein